MGQCGYVVKRNLFDLLRKRSRLWTLRLDTCSQTVRNAIYHQPTTSAARRDPSRLQIQGFFSSSSGVFCQASNFDFHP